MRRLARWIPWLWRTRDCAHPKVRRIGGDERRYGYEYWCLACDKVLRRQPVEGEAP